MSPKCSLLLVCTVSFLWLVCVSVHKAGCVWLSLLLNPFFSFSEFMIHRISVPYNPELQACLKYSSSTLSFFRWDSELEKYRLEVTSVVMYMDIGRNIDKLGIWCGIDKVHRCLSELTRSVILNTGYRSGIPNIYNGYSTGH